MVNQAFPKYDTYRIVDNLGICCAQVASSVDVLAVVHKNLCIRCGQAVCNQVVRFAMI